MSDKEIYADISDRFAGKEFRTVHAPRSGAFFTQPTRAICDGDIPRPADNRSQREIDRDINARLPGYRCAKVYAADDSVNIRVYVKRANG